jgi:hypothetical protein
MLKALLTFALLLVPGFLLAQEGAPVEASANAINWLQIIALAVNTVGVTLGVQALKLYYPGFPRPVKTMLTVLAGPLLLWASNGLSNLLGYPIDFSSLIDLFGAGVLTSFAAMVPFKVGKAQGRRG